MGVQRVPIRIGPDGFTNQESTKAGHSRGQSNARAFEEAMDARKEGKARMRIMLDRGGLVILGIYGLVCLGFEFINIPNHLYDFGMPWWGPLLMFIGMIPLTVWASNVNDQIMRTVWDESSHSFIVKETKRD